MCMLTLIWLVELQQNSTHSYHLILNIASSEADAVSYVSLREMRKFFDDLILDRKKENSGTDSSILTFYFLKYYVSYHKKMHTARS